MKGFGWEGTLRGGVLGLQGTQTQAVMASPFWSLAGCAHAPLSRGLCDSECARPREATCSEAGPAPTSGPRHPTPSAGTWAPCGRGTAGPAQVWLLRTLGLRVRSCWLRAASLLRRGGGCSAWRLRRVLFLPGPTTAGPWQTTSVFTEASTRGSNYSARRAQAPRGQGNEAPRLTERGTASCPAPGPTGARGLGSSLRRPWRPLLPKSHLGCRAPTPMTRRAVPPQRGPSWCPVPSPSLASQTAGQRGHRAWSISGRPGSGSRSRSGLGPPSGAPALPGPHRPIVWGQWLPEPGPSPAGSHKEPLLCPLKGSQCLRAPPLGPHPSPAWLGPRPPQGPANPARHVGADQSSCHPHAGMAPHMVPELDTVPGGPGSGPLPRRPTGPC